MSDATSGRPPDSNRKLGDYYPSPVPSPPADCGFYLAASPLPTAFPVSLQQSAALEHSAVLLLHRTVKTLLAGQRYHSSVLPGREGSDFILCEIYYKLILNLVHWLMESGGEGARKDEKKKRGDKGKRRETGVERGGVPSVSM